MDFQAFTHQHISRALREGARRLAALSDSGRIVRQGHSFGDLTHDTEIRADLVLGEFYEAKLTTWPNVYSVRVEGRPEKIIGTGNLCVYCDPLDGSLNEKRRGLSRGLPRSGCITVFEKGDDVLRYRDVRAAGLIDYTLNGVTHDLWLAWWNGNAYVTTVNDKRAQTSSERALDIRESIVIGEMYYPQNRERLVRAFRDQKGWLRNPGSAAYEMGLVADGVASTFICGTQKQHELPTGFALVLGAGGVAVDWDGHPLANTPFDFDTQQAVVLAANDVLAAHIIEQLHV